jgi:5-formyltetrahydrofolate cyclo-ligase
MQVLDDPLPRLVHDIPVDLVVTPDEVIETRHQLSWPGGIYWDLLPEEKIAAIPVLEELRQRA